MNDEDIMILDNTSISHSSYFEDDLYLGNTKQSLSESDIYMHFRYTNTKISKNQHALIASFNFIGKNTPNYNWTFVFIYNNELNINEFLKDLRIM